MTKATTGIQKYRKYYDTSKFWEVLKKSAKKIGRTPVRHALTLYYMYQDGLSLPDKLLVLGALGYLILPVDLLPDTIPLLGWTDDAGALAFVWNKLKDKATPEVRQKAAARLLEWFD